MPRTAIPVTEVGQNAALNGPTFTAADATNDMEFKNDGRTQLVIRNESGGNVAVTITSVADEHGRTGDITATVAAGDELYLNAHLLQRLWNQSGVVHVDFDVDTSITVIAIRHL